MPAIETSGLHQKAVLWVESGFDNDGNVKVVAAVEIDVRWIEGKGDIRNAQSGSIDFDATAVIDREIAVGSIMWKGELDDYVATVVKYQVVDYREVPDIKGRKFRRVVKLMKFGTELPTLA